MKKYLNGMMTGVIVGATVGMAVMPQLDRKTQKMVKNAGKKLVNFAESSYEIVINII